MDFYIHLKINLIFVQYMMWQNSNSRAQTNSHTNYSHWICNI